MNKLNKIFLAIIITLVIALVIAIISDIYLINSTLSLNRQIYLKAVAVGESEFKFEWKDNAFQELVLIERKDSAIGSIDENI